jgi:hypothetical protein
MGIKALILSLMMWPCLAMAAANPFDQFDEFISAQDARDRPYFDKCMSDKLKGIPSNGLQFVARQCVQLSIPKMCRSPQLVSTDCLASCKKANILSKRFGDCALGD